MSTNPRNRSTAATPPVPTEELEAMLTRLRLPAIRDRLDALLEEAARREMNLREALAWLCVAEVARKCQPTRRKSSLPTRKGPHFLGGCCCLFRPWSGALAGAVAQRHALWDGSLEVGGDQWLTAVAVQYGTIRPLWSEVGAPRPHLRPRGNRPRAGSVLTVASP